MDEPTPDFDNNSAMESESELDLEEDDLLPDAEPVPIPTAVESLVSGRARRSTAGNRLATLLQQEADAEDTLFMEDEDDNEFQVKDRREDLDDLLLDSSSEDEDDRAADGKGGDEDFEGEKELQRVEKEEKRAKKRKADEAFMKPRRVPTKKVTIKEKDTATTTATTSATDSPVPPDEPLSALTRPRKKSERVSWVPEFTAVRASTRRLALQNRTETMRRLEESEKRRLHTIQLMEAAAAKKEKRNPKREMTQEERLAEAKLTEARNLKSLNRWEVMEKARLEEQRKKLAALQNRRLVGPVITYWSGRAEWNAKGKLVKVGKGLVEELDDEIEVGKNKKRTRKEKGKDKKENDKKDDADKKKECDDSAVLQETGRAENASISTSTIEKSSENSSETSSKPLSDVNIVAPPVPAQSAPPTPLVPPPASLLVDREAIPSFLEGIYDYAALPDPTAAPDQATPEKKPSVQEPTLNEPSVNEPKLEEPPNEVSTRNLVVLENFDPDVVRTKDGILKALFASQKRQWPIPKPLCVITHQPARFRDPSTGMPYASLHAYNEIRRILRGEMQWSCLLGAYIGVPNAAASGVPEGFLEDAKVPC